ncbi:hypothetical protein TPY_1404 [Sulfobacillus acidophilus TPY]|uniref:Uncharacterized protein n=1 Tax=Sulfobacillus acidophilus (strain ATCC 700253 / DSM 10332 / NAL) TaxID=679936 RepID=G8TU54_SULAD|nr:hypothetical protein TPY_1404 [Sulfobacillus acidophilus TPY]AEW05726.1 hypothetical protein Sulac_2253 [Sulfobacillus acidophilus DSM 10332]
MIQGHFLWGAVALAAGVFPHTSLQHTPTVSHGTPTVVVSSLAAMPGEKETLSLSGFPAVKTVTYWIQYPNNRWLALPGSGPLQDASWTVPGTGSYVVDAAVRFGGDKSIITTPTAVVFSHSTLAWASVPTALALGQNMTVATSAVAVANPVYQLWFETPSGVWQSAGGFGESPQWTLPLAQEGQYHLIVYAKPLNADDNAASLLGGRTAVVNAYGTPSQLVEEPAQPLVADGIDRQTFQWAIEDRAGDVVPTANGVATLNWLAPPGTIGNGTTAETDGQAPLVFHQGLAEMTVQSGKDTGSINWHVQWENLSGQGAWTVVQPQATTVGISAPDTPYIANESGNPAVFNVTVLDQVGNPMPTGIYHLTAGIMGGTGQFHDLTQGPDAITVDGGQPPTPVTVYSIAGSLGPMTLTVSGDGLPMSSSTIQAVLGGQPEQMGVTASSPQLTPGQPITLTLTQLTSTGGVVDPASVDNAGYTVTVINSQGNGVGAGFLLGGVPYTGPVTIPIAVGPNDFYAIAQTVTLDAVDVSPGTYIVIVSDPSGLWKSSTPLKLTVL